MNVPVGETDETIYIRLHFSKHGPARYLSHINLVTVWERGFRRAGVALSYSEGFSPRPVLRFGPPIPVGYFADDELLDSRIDGPVDPDELTAALNANLPEGIRVSGAETLLAKPPSLMARARSAGYEVRLDAPPDDLAGRIANLLALPELTVEIARGKRTRSIDIRGATLRLEALSTDSVAMRLRIGEGAACRPEDILAALSLSTASVRRTDVEYELD